MLITRDQHKVYKQQKRKITKSNDPPCSPTIDGGTLAADRTRERKRESTVKSRQHIQTAPRYRTLRSVERVRKEPYEEELYLCNNANNCLSSTYLYRTSLHHEPEAWEYTPTEQYGRWNTRQRCDK